MQNRFANVMSDWSATRVKNVHKVACHSKLLYNASPPLLMVFLFTVDSEPAKQWLIRDQI